MINFQKTCRAYTLEKLTFIIYKVIDIQTPKNFHKDLKKKQHMHSDNGQEDNISVKFNDWTKSTFKTWMDCTAHL
jgi:hypothetical protein